MAVGGAKLVPGGAKVIGEATVKVQELLEAKDKRLAVPIVDTKTNAQLNTKANLIICAEVLSVLVGTAPSQG